MDKDEKITLGIIIFIGFLIGAQTVIGTGTRLGIEIGVFLTILMCIGLVIVHILKRKELI